MTDVPCNGCRLCCQSAAITLQDGDNPDDYDCEPWNNTMKLKNKPNGDCIYLGEKGCTIYERRPQICRVYDCRKQFLSLKRRERELYVSKGLCAGEEFERGKELQWTLSAEERRKCIERRKHGPDNAS